jgi:Tfp pilus assembly protein PilO
MANRNSRLVRITILIVCAAVFIGAGLWLHRAKSSRLQQLKQTLAEKEAAVEEANTKISQIGDLEARNEELGRQIAVLEPNLPTAAYIPTFLAQIQKLAGQTDNHLILIKPKPKPFVRAAAPAPAPVNEGEGAGTQSPTTSSAGGNNGVAVSPYDQVDIELGFDGTYLSTLEFLQRLRAFPKMIAVNEISLKPNTNSRDAGTMSDPVLNVTLQLSAVIAKEQ